MFRRADRGWRKGVGLKASDVDRRSTEIGGWRLMGDGAEESPFAPGEVRSRTMGRES